MGERDGLISTPFIMFVFIVMGAARDQVRATTFADAMLLLVINTFISNQLVINMHHFPEWEFGQLIASIHVTVNFDGPVRSVSAHLPPC